MKIFVKPIARPAERTGVWRCSRRQRIQRPHIHADQLVSWKADHVGQRAVNAQNIVLFVVNYDVVADRVENVQPVPVRLLCAGKKERIFERDAGVSSDGAQQLLIVRDRRRAAIGEAEHTQ